MPPVFAAIAPLLFGVGLLYLGYGLFGTLLSVRMAAAGFSDQVAGIVMSGFYIGMMTGSLTIPRLVQRVGHIRVLSGLSAVMTAATITHALFVAPIPWFGLRLIEGFAMSGIYLCVESWLGDKATNKTRGVVFSAYLTVCYLSWAVSQFLLTTADVKGFFLFGLATMLISLAQVPITLSRSAPPALPKPHGFGLMKVWRASPLGVTVVLASGLASSVMYSVLPRFGADIGLSSLGIAWLMAWSIVGGLLVQWPVGRLSDLFDRRSVVLGVALLLVISAAGAGGITAFLPASLGNGIDLGSWIGRLPVSLWLLICCAGIGAAVLGTYPLGVSLVNDRIAADDRVAASGGLILIYGVPAIGGPLMASNAMQWLGAVGLMLYWSLIGLGLAGITLVVLKRRRDDRKRTEAAAVSV